METIGKIQKALQEFATERDWNKFHTPRNLVMALSGEVGELAAEFQWIKDGEDGASSLNSEKLRDISLEIADVAIYLFRLADVLGVDLESSVYEKIKINKARFKPNSN
jgi:dCTP diphosphatase